MTDALLLLFARVATISPTPSPTSSTFSPGVISTRATDDNVVRPGWLGFLVFLAMAVAVYFLLRSFVRHLKRVDFDEGVDPGAVPAPKVDPSGRPSGD